jgi:transcriptional regulator with XRE-family HTH domain
MQYLRRELIDARGRRTQKEIGEICGVKQQTYSHWERGRTNPPIRKMLILEKELGVPKETLFCDLFNSPPE